MKRGALVAAVGALLAGCGGPSTTSRTNAGALVLKYNYPGDRSYIELRGQPEFVKAMRREFAQQPPGAPWVVASAAQGPKRCSYTVQFRGAEPRSRTFRGEKATLVAYGARPSPSAYLFCTGPKLSLETIPQFFRAGPVTVLKGGQGG
jgi:MoCo/4Fe-4S cofactor protein with predicted Tat translocation signal